MTVSSGFFNSVNHDRLYDAEQLSSIFDGIIIDGVYENYGDAFMVTANQEANSSVLIGTGRAWFDHTWTVNDSVYSMQLDPPNEMLGRVDAIVIDVDRTTDVRKNTIIYIKGSESTPSAPPSLISSELHNQYPIAYITRTAGSDSPIQQSQISYQVGVSGDCPVVTGVLEAQNLDNLWRQLEDEFDTWWDGIKATLDENTVTNLQNQINDLKEKVEGDDAQVGLLTKPVYEAFKSGNYGLNASSYSFSFPSQIDRFALKNDTFLGTFFLPDGKAAYISLCTKSSTGELAKPCILTRILTTDGVQSAIFSEQISNPSNSQLLNTVQIGFNLYPVQINSYPVKVLCILPYIYNSVLGCVGVMMTITSQMNISYSYTGYNTSIASNNSTIDYCTHGYITTSGNYITFAEGNKTPIAGCVFSISSEGVISGKTYSASSSYIKNGYPESRPVVLYKYNNELIGSDTGALTGSPKDGYKINESTLDLTVVSDIPKNAEPELTLMNDVSFFNVSSSEGVVETIINENNEAEESELYDYFMGASNVNMDLPEGVYQGIKTSTGIKGITSNGYQAYIGTNGGIAILNKKLTVSQITTNKIVKWCKGYINTDSISAYIICDDESDNLWEENWIKSISTDVIPSVVMIKGGNS